MIFFARSSGVSSSTPQARASIGSPANVESLTSPQSVQTMPSKPSRSRSRSVTICRLKLKPTSSYSVPIGMP